MQRLTPVRRWNRELGKSGVDRSLHPLLFGGGVLLAGVGLQWIGSTATVWTIFGLMLLASFIALRSKEIRNVPPLEALARQERPTAV
jgi:hypothetical protein